MTNGIARPAAVSSSVSPMRLPVASSAAWERKSEFARERIVAGCGRRAFRELVSSSAALDARTIRLGVTLATRNMSSPSSVSGFPPAVSATARNSTTGLALAMPSRRASFG